MLKPANLFVPFFNKSFRFWVFPAAGFIPSAGFSNAGLPARLR